MNETATEPSSALAQFLRQTSCGSLECQRTHQCDTVRGGICPNVLREEMKAALAMTDQTNPGGNGSERGALARNERVQARYDELMREGKHGHYETLFRVVREEVEAALSSPAVQVPAEDAELVRKMRGLQVCNPWAKGWVVVAEEERDIPRHPPHRAMKEG